jgi:hypothetical protein
VLQLGHQAGSAGGNGAVDMSSAQPQQHLQGEEGSRRDKPTGGVTSWGAWGRQGQMCANQRAACNRAVDISSTQRQRHLHTSKDTCSHGEGAADGGMRAADMSSTQPQRNLGRGMSHVGCWGKVVRNPIATPGTALSLPRSQGTGIAPPLILT